VPFGALSFPAKLHSNFVFALTRTAPSGIADRRSASSPWRARRPGYRPTRSFALAGDSRLRHWSPTYVFASCKACRLED
jgi:hypothetical protein